MKHTPGPWETSRLATPAYAPEYGVYAEGPNCDRDLARVIGDNSAADAALIKAAPDLLEALTLLEELLSAGQPPGTEDLFLARDAIAKASGESP